MELHHARDVRRETSASPEAVFSIIADGWLFPGWVVGASRMREVDDDWPRVGSCIHHSFGLWPAVIDDTSTVVSSTPPHAITLRAGGWPAGEALVSISIQGHDPGSVITIREDAVQGPGLLVPRTIRQAVMVVRNRETLHRLALLAEGRTEENRT